MDVVFKPGTDTPFSPIAFNDLEMGEGGLSENPIVLDEKEDKENNSPKIPVFERPTEPAKLPRVCPFEWRIKNVPEFSHRTFFE